MALEDLYNFIPSFRKFRSNKNLNIMLVNDELYFQTFCKLFDAVVEMGGLEVAVENLQKNHFFLLSRKINRRTCDNFGIQPATLRDYRYIYRKEKRFSVRQNRLDLMCEFLGYNGWNEFRNTHFNVNHTKQNKNQVVRLLVLPDKRYGEVGKFEGQISELIFNRYEELKAELEIDNLELVYEESLKETPTGINRIKDLGSTHQADLVIWPEYHHGKKPTMRVRFLQASPNQSPSTYYKSKYQKVSRLTDIHEGMFLTETDILLFSLLGIAAFHNGETTRAIIHFEHVLTLDPRHIEALYNLGLLYKETDHLSESATYFQKVLEQDHIDSELIEGAKTHLSHLLESKRATSDTITLPSEKCSPQANPFLITSEKEDTSFSDEKSKLPDLDISLGEKQLANGFVKHQTTSPDYLFVLKGDNSVLMTKNLEPLLRSKLIHEDESIMFLTSHTDLALLSVNNFNTYHVRTSRKEVPIKEVLITIDQSPEAKKGNIDPCKKSSPLLLLSIKGTKTEKTLPRNDWKSIIFSESCQNAFSLERLRITVPS